MTDFIIMMGVAGAFVGFLFGCVVMYISDSPIKFGQLGLPLKHKHQWKSLGFDKHGLETVDCIHCGEKQRISVSLYDSKQPVRTYKID